MQTNLRWVRLGCSLLNVLMASQDGIRFLQEDEFLGQLVKSFAQLDPVGALRVYCIIRFDTIAPQLNPSPTSDPIFSKKRMQETLTSGYFEMLGTMSKRKEGIESVFHSAFLTDGYANVMMLRLLEKFKLFTAFYHLSELRSREDLITGIIENLDYSM